MPGGEVVPNGTHIGPGSTIIARSRNGVTYEIKIDDERAPQAPSPILPTPKTHLHSPNSQQVAARSTTSLNQQPLGGLTTSQTTAHDVWPGTTVDVDQPSEVNPDQGPYEVETPVSGSLNQKPDSRPRVPKPTFRTLRRMGNIALFAVPAVIVMNAGNEFFLDQGAMGPFDTVDMVGDALTFYKDFISKIVGGF